MAESYDSWSKLFGQAPASKTTNKNPNSSWESHFKVEAGQRKKADAKRKKDIEDGTIDAPKPPKPRDPRAEAIASGQIIPAKNSNNNTKYDQRGDAIDTQPAKKSNSILDKVKHVGSNVATATGHTVRAVARPAIDVATGQGGKAAHDTAQLSSNVSGGSFNLLSNAARYAPKAVYREARGKSIDDIQKKVFGSTDSGTIAKKTGGALLQAGSFAVGGGGVSAATKGTKAASLLAKAKTVAPLTTAGGAGGAGYTIQNNPNASVKDVAKSAALGAAGGAVIPFAAAGAGKVISKASPYAKGSPKEFIQKTQANSLLDQVRTPSNIGKEAIEGANPKPVINSIPESVLKESQVKKMGASEVLDRKQTAQALLPNHPNNVNPDGTITLYHGTGRGNQEAIDKYGKFWADSYFTPVKTSKDSPSATSYANSKYGKEMSVMEIKVDPRGLRKFNDGTVSADNGLTRGKDGIWRHNNSEPTLEQISQQGDHRPQAELQTAIEQAHNAGDNAKVSELIGQLPADAQPSMKSALGIKDTGVSNGGAASATGEAERGTSKIAQDIQTKAVARGLKDTFGEAGGYDKITLEDQASKAVALTNDRQTLNKVISGEIPLPNGLRATALIKAVEEHPQLSKDHELINKLSQAEHLTGASSKSAQELRLAAERSDHSPIEVMRQIREARSKVVERKTGKTINKAVSAELKAIRATKPKVTRQTFQEFVETLKC